MSLPIIKPPTSSTSAANPGAGIDYDLFLDCIHCGLCTSSCPTYIVTGNENDGPRGRIHLMRAVTDERIPLTDEVRRHLDLCLDCRSCETACPSGVKYGQLIEPFRIAMDGGVVEGGFAASSLKSSHNSAETHNNDWFRRWILLGLFPYPDRLRKALIPARISQRVGLMTILEKTGLIKLLPTKLRQMALSLPPASKVKEPAFPDMLPAVGRRRARVALFTGCVGDVMFHNTNWATARVLQQNGCDVIIPKGQVCCGAINFHAADSTTAKQMANTNAAAFKPDDVDAVIVNVAGCGAMLKEYGHHWHDADSPSRESFASKVRDVHEFLDQLGPVAPKGEILGKATYHDACHLVHAQKIKLAPRRLLGMIPGLAWQELPESEVCCGAAGTYNLTQPEMSAILSRRKLDHIISTGANLIVTANAGCLLQIMREARARGVKLKIVHPMELLDASYRGVTLD